MAEGPKVEQLPIGYGTQSVKIKTSWASSFLSALAFKEHGLRLGLELSLIFLFYSLIESFAPWESLPIDLGWAGVYSWFSACLLVAALDRALISKPLWTLRQSTRFDLLGAYDRALNSLKTISPHSSSLVRYPVQSYHLQRMKIFCHAENFVQADYELGILKSTGIPLEKWFLAKSYLLRAKGMLEEAHAEIERAKVSLGNTTRLRLEHAILLYEARADYWAIKNAFKEVMSLPDSVTENQDSTVSVATSLWEVSRLRTGHAEEALESLSDLISRYRQLARYVDSLRPHLSLLLLERGLYFASHKMPDDALIDMKEAQLICSYPQHQKLAQQIKEELAWRHP